MVEKIVITVLVENTIAVPGLTAEKGLSLLIEDGRLRILFDTGKSGAFLANAQKLGIDLQHLTHIVFSHGHYDHTGGIICLMDYLKENNSGTFPVLVAHPDVFEERGIYTKLFHKMLRVRDLGAPIRKKQAMELFPCEFHRHPFWIHEDLVFLGSVCRTEKKDKPRVFGSIMRLGSPVKDEILDDSALVYRTEKGLVIIVGCAHSGICNIMEYAKQITGSTKIHAVIGGLHLQHANSRDIDAVAGYFKNEAIPFVHSCHCTGNASERLPHQVPTMTSSVLTF